MPTATNLPFGAPLNVACELTSALRIRVGWIDNSTYETEFRIEVSVEGAPFVPLDVVPSTTMASTGTPYVYNVPVDLLADTDYQFRVQARNLGTGQKSDPASSGICHTGIPITATGCVVGVVQLEGRSDHTGAGILLDGIPAGVTGPSGAFEFCGVPEGNHAFAAANGCYLSAAHGEAFVTGGETLRLPYTALTGGDVTGDELVDLFDLVRTGAAYSSRPPSDPAADCTGDGAVNLFDMVIIGANYGDSGPAAWGGSTSAALAGTARAGTRGNVAGATSAGPSLDWSRARSVAHHAGGRGGVVPRVTSLDDDTLAVTLTARGVSGVFGADLGLVYDPERLKPLDAVPGEPGIQAEPGAAWGDSPYIAVNGVDRERHAARFVASLRSPSAPIGGDLVLATFRFRALSDEIDGAYALTDVRLADRAGQAIPVRWEGIEVVPDWESRLRRLFVPWVGQRVELRLFR